MVVVQVSERPRVNEEQEKLAQEHYVKRVASRVLGVLQEIRDKRGWSNQPSGYNFSAQLLAPHEPFTMSLTQSAQTGKLSPRSGPWQAILVLENIPDLVANKRSEETMGDLMFIFYLELATKLGFCELAELNRKNPRIRAIGLGKSTAWKQIVIKHPTEPLSLCLSSTGDPVPEKTSLFLPVNTISLRFHNPSRQAKNRTQ